MRCKWVDENNELYVKYHDLEWGVPSYDDTYLYEMLVLESFQAGLSWIDYYAMAEPPKTVFRATHNPLTRARQSVTESHINIY